MEQLKKKGFHMIRSFSIVRIFGPFLTSCLLFDLLVCLKNKPKYTRKKQGEKSVKLNRIGRVEAESRSGVLVSPSGPWTEAPPLTI